MYFCPHSPLGGGGYGSAQGDGVTGVDHTLEACHGVSYQGAYPQRALSGVRVAGRCSEGLPVFTRSLPGRFPGARLRVVALAKPRDAGERQERLIRSRCRRQ
jgi:hypothetical protein